MAMFAVYCPPDVAPADAPEALRFVAERPSLWAFLVPPLWLAARRLWVGLIIWFAAAAALWAVTRGLDPAPAGIVRALGWLWFAAAARDIEQAALDRAGWTLIAVVNAPSRAAAEIRYFTTALAAAAPAAAAPTGGRRPVAGAGVVGFEGFGGASR